MLSTRFLDDEKLEIGVDEAGRGSFWGPIVAGALILPRICTEEQTVLFSQLRDSKKISPKKRTRLSKEIKEQLPLHGIGIVTAEEINEHGITWANREAFRRAIQDVPVENRHACRLLIDGTLSLDNWIGEQEQMVEGDNRYVAIAGASILAKVAHDEWIHAYAVAHPECNERYDLVKSNGYGTAAHREGIGRYGGHELHRVIYIQRWLPGSVQKGKQHACFIRF